MENQTSQILAHRPSSRETVNHCSSRGHAEKMQFAKWPQDEAVSSVRLNSPTRVSSLFPSQHSRARIKGNREAAG